MEEGPSSPTTLVVSSPRRTLSLLHNHRSSAFASSSDSAFPVHDKHTRTDAGFTGEHGPKPSEVYGFVGSITTVIATGGYEIRINFLDDMILGSSRRRSLFCWVIYLVWAYTPEPWLHSQGITYYPSKYWVLAVPSFVIVSVFLMMVLYLGLNFLATPPPYSLNAIYDEYSHEPSAFTLSEGMEKPIDPISDVGINQINHLMFGNANTTEEPHLCGDAYRQPTKRCWMSSIRKF